MKVHKRSLRLAGLYLAIIMSISLLFSVSIYELSVAELERGLRLPLPTVDRRIEEFAPDFRRAILEDREAAFLEAKQRVLVRLILTNGFILVVAGALSYYLALRTLRPIEEAGESLERFTADASHELRTPIAAMQTEIEVALMDPKLKLSDAKVLLQSNLEELAKLTALSEGLLKLARASSSELVTSKVVVSHIIAKAVKSVQPIAKTKSITIKTPPKSELAVQGEEASLVDLIKILLDNALKYSPKKSTVNVALQVHSRSVHIQIADQGSGIKASELPHIFDRFYRADASRTKQTDGYGIGLAIAKNIAELHGGSIAVESRPENGSIFTIKLPIS